MSELSIFERSQEIRFETEIYANTCERVADVLDDINATKANKTDVSQAIQDVIDEMSEMEQDIYAYVDDEVDTLSSQLDNKKDKPVWTGVEGQYFVVSTSGSPINLRPITLEANRVPYWTGNTFYNSPISISTLRVGINKSSPSEALDVAGNILADTYRLNTFASLSTPGSIYTDGVYLKFVGTDGISRDLAFQSKVVSDTWNPPTLAQLASLGIKRGDFYKCTTTNQIAMFNGEQLTEWVVTGVTQWNLLSADQKLAVKIFSLQNET